MKMDIPIECPISSTISKIQNPNFKNKKMGAYLRSPALKLMEYSVALMCIYISYELANYSSA